LNIYYKPFVVSN